MKNQPFLRKNFIKLSKMANVLDKSAMKQ